MKKIGFLLATFFILLMGFWVGLMVFFPGDTASALVENRLNRFGPIQARLSPAKLGFLGVYVETLDVVRQEGQIAHPLLTLHDVSIPIGFALFQGLPLKAILGDNGTVTAFFPWAQGSDATLESEVILHEIPVPKVVQPLSAKGHLSFKGRFIMDGFDNITKKLPEGEFQLTGKSIEIRGLRAIGNDLPLTTLENIDIDIESKGKLTVRKFAFKGDLQGRIEGDISPNINALRLSKFNLKIETSLRNSWVEKLGNLKTLTESFLTRGQLAVNVRGTIASPQLDRVRR